MEIIVECPFCKTNIPVNALKCSHCTADLTNQEIQEKIQKETKNKIRKENIKVLAGLLILIILTVGFLVAVSTPSPPSTKLSYQKEPSYAEKLPNFLSFICSKPENSHTSFYYLITSRCPTNQSFILPEKITDVTVRLSTIQGKAGWDTNFLCSPETEFDLPFYQWQILTVGSDCGLGAEVSPCDTNFISDSTGVTGIVVFPDIKGYVSGIWKYCKKDALLKITGKVVK